MNAFTLNVECTCSIGKDPHTVCVSEILRNIVPVISCRVTLKL